MGSGGGGCSFRLSLEKTPPRCFAFLTRVARSGLDAVPGERYIDLRLEFCSRSCSSASKKMSFEELAEGGVGLLSLLAFVFRFGVGVAGITVGVDGWPGGGILLCPGLVLVLILAVLALGVWSDFEDADRAGLGMGVGTSSSTGEEMRRVPPLLSASSKSLSVTLREPLRWILCAPPSAPGGCRYWPEVSALSPPRNEDGGSRSPVDAVRPAGPGASWRVPNNDASLGGLASDGDGILER